MSIKCNDICTECGNECEVVIVDDETRLCEHCLELLDYEECDECNEYWPTDSVEFFELEDGRRVCEYCYEDIDEESED